jgi:hypothetical protein
MTDFTDTGRTIEVQGRPYPVRLDAACQFRADLDGCGELIAASWADLEEKARAYQGQRFELRITAIAHGEIRNGTITGFHARTKQMLLRWEGTQGSQHLPGELSGAMPRLGPEDAAELAALLEARQDTQRALDGFITARRFPSVKQAAEDAQRQAAGIELAGGSSARREQETS